MVNYHYITMLFMGVNICVLIVLFSRYFELRKKQIPAVNYCLWLLAASMFFSIISTIALLLPEGQLLENMVAMLAASGVFVNTFFAVIAVNLVGHGRGLIFRFQKLLLLIPVLLLVLCATNHFHHLVIASVIKEPDGFLYSANYGVASVVMTIYSLGLILLAIIHVLRYGKLGMLRKPWIRWLLVIGTILPAFFLVLEECVPVLGELRITLFTTWISVAIICSVFFGYLFSARQKALDNIDDAYVVFDLNGYCVDLNKKGAEFFVRYAGTDNPLPMDLSRLIGTPNLLAKSEYEMSLPYDGGNKHFIVRSFPLSSGINQYCGNGYIIHEVTEFVQKMSQLRSIAVEDPLTKAKNRRFLASNADAFLQRAAHANKNVSALMCDIDHFKKVNDQYGHMVGDEILVGTFKIIQKNLRRDDFVIRYGGEEFLALCMGTDYAQAKSLAERIRVEVERKVFSTLKGAVKITISIGVYTKQASTGDQIGQYIKHADERMYDAKQSGRNMVR